jgi:hypothetical protein
MSDHRALLNGPQRTHLSVLAASIEDTVAEIERLLDPRANHGATLTHYSEDLPPGFAERVRPVLQELRALVAVFAGQFALDPRSYSRASTIGAHVTAEVNRLDDSSVKQLRGYGEVAPQLDSVLAPALEEFRRQLTAIRGMLKD